MVSKSLNQITPVPYTFSSSKVAEGETPVSKLLTKISLRGGKPEKDMRWARQRPPGRICAATYPRRLQDENGGQRGGLRLRGERYRKLCVASNFGPQPPFFKGNNEKCP